MRVGCCTKLDDIGRLAQAGFEYAECTVSALKPEEDDVACAPILAALRASPLPVWAFNVFMPGDIKIVGPQVDEARLHRYAERALERIHAVGGRLLVFGSGGAQCP